MHEKAGTSEVFPADQALHQKFRTEFIIPHLNFLKVCKFMHAAKTIA